MNLLEACGERRWLDFGAIRDDTVPTTIAEDADLFVGRCQQVTLTLSNGTTQKVRDIVVLGSLTIESSNPENTDNPPKLEARNVLIPGNHTLNNVSFHYKNIDTTKGVDAFLNKRKELVDQHIIQPLVYEQWVRARKRLEWGEPSEQQVLSKTQPSTKSISKKK